MGIGLQVESRWDLDPPGVSWMWCLLSPADSLGKDRSVSCSGHSTSSVLLQMWAVPHSNSSCRALNLVQTA